MGYTPNGTYVQPLARAFYTPAGIVTANSSSTTFAAVDTTNLRATFVAPSSGTVRVRYGGSANVTGGAQVYLGLLNGATPVSVADSIYDDATHHTRVDVEDVITGLTPGQSYSFDLALANGNGATGTASLAYGGANGVSGRGSAYVEVTT